jgi:hypothetical protein
LGNLDDDDDDNGNVDLIRAWRGVRESIKSSATDSVGYHELRDHKPQIDEKC